MPSSRTVRTRIPKIDRTPAFAEESVSPHREKSGTGTSPNYWLCGARTL